jgi:hypothetical protein
MEPVLILEGVTGAGKTSVLAELRERLDQAVVFISEEETLGNLMHQIRDPEWREQPSFEALESVLRRVEREAPGRPFLIERFHLTAYALFPEWNCYQDFDERLPQLGARLVLLTFPEQQAEERSIQRSDRENWAEEMDAWYGSREQAVAAVVESQRLRWQGLMKTKLPFLHIDTRETEWSRYAATILAYSSARAGVV